MGVQGIGCLGWEVAGFCGSVDGRVCWGGCCRGGGCGLGCVLLWFWLWSWLWL